MKALYRGCDIEAHREPALGGWSEVYWSAFRRRDGFEIDSGFGGGNVREMFKQMKETVDRFKDEYKGRSVKWSDDQRADSLAIIGMKP